VSTPPNPVNFEDISRGGKKYLRCGTCGRYGRPGWPHDCGVTKSWCRTLEEVERRHGVVDASKILDLEPESARELVLERVAIMESMLAVWPESMRTPSFVMELREIATTHLVSIGVDDGGELVEAAILRAVDAASRARAQEVLDRALEEAERAREASFVIGDARRNWLVKLASDMRRNRMERDAIVAALALSNAQRCRPELSEEDVGAIATAVCRYDPASVPRKETVKKDASREKKGVAPTLDEYESMLDFKVEKVLLVASDPPRYYLKFDCDAKEHLFTTQELLGIAPFRGRFMEALGFPPLGLPKQIDDWHRIVKKWCKQATRYEQPDDASPEMALRLHIARGLRSLGLGTTVADLEDGKYLLTKAGEMAIDSATARKIAHEYDLRAGIQAICDHLRHLGFHGKSCRLGSDGASVYAWVGPIPTVAAPPPDSDEGSSNGNGAVHEEVEPMAASAYDDAPLPTDPYTEDPDDLPL
jgi:hypothetical protein